MTGKVYFTDGRIEDITEHTFNPANRRKNNEFYFVTESGDYAYSDAVFYYTTRHNFYKHEDQWWLVTTEIDHVEFNMEMM